MSITADHDILVIARKIRMDLTSLQAKLSELIAIAAKLPAAESGPSCPECGLLAAALPQSATLADHRFRAHDIDGSEDVA